MAPASSVRSEGRSERSTPEKPPPLWRNRDFTLLWSGQVVSTIGTRVSSLAFPLLVLALTHSPAKAGLVGFAQTLPFLLFYLPAGALVDRWNRKRVMLVADAGRALALGSLALALALDRLTLVQIAVVAFIEGSLFVFFQLSEGAALPHVVPKEQLPAALAQNQARDQGADLAGQPLGGFLFGIGHLVPFVFDAVSYAVSFVRLLFVRPTSRRSGFTHRGTSWRKSPRGSPGSGRGHSCGRSSSSSRGRTSPSMRSRS